MRVVDRSTARNYMKYLNKARGDYASTNNKIASGKRFEKISQDVVAGTKVLRVRTEMCKAETQYSNLKSAQEALSSTELAMKAINGILTTVNSEKITAAISEEKGEAGRQAIANEIEAMRSEMLQYANTKYNSRYVFGGSNSSYSPPFSLDSDGNLLYNEIDVDLIEQDIDGTYFYKKAGVKTKINLDTDVYLDVGLGIKLDNSSADPNTAFQISYSGLDILGFGKSANGISNNIFNVLTKIENNIRNFDSAVVNEHHAQLRTLCDSFRANLTNIGAKTNLLETMQERLESSMDSYNSQVNTLMGINDAEEAMNQSMNEYVLKAVIQMGARILPVSLMDFLR